jgi:hypothetical protein
MIVAHRFLCLFSSDEVRRASFFGGRDGHWLTEIDAGACEFVPLLLDAEVAALGTSGLFAGATLLCRAGDLDPSLAVAVGEAAAGFQSAGRGFELVAAEAPVALLARLAELAPSLVARCHQDGEVRPESPSWWRDRARRHLAGRAGAGEAPGTEEADAEAELRAFVARRRGARAAGPSGGQVA